MTIYVKLVDGSADAYPYSIRQFKQDNPNTSFPKTINNDLLASYSVYPVTIKDVPDYDHYTQSLEEDSNPSYVTDSSGSNWSIGFTVTNRPQDDAETAVRSKRDALIAETDYLALSDNTLSTEMSTYRQSLRDVTTQEGFPYSVIWPTL